MKIRTTLSIASVANLCAASTALPTDFTKINKADCDKLGSEAMSLLPPVPYANPVWRQGKNTKELWYNSGVPDGPLSNNTGSRTIYCATGFGAVTAEAYKQSVPKLYCNGTEGVGKVKLQPIPTWVGDHCESTDISDIQERIEKLSEWCGCKNQAPNPPENAEYQ